MNAHLSLIVKFYFYFFFEFLSLFWVFETANWLLFAGLFVLHLYCHLTKTIALIIKCGRVLLNLTIEFAC